MEITEKSELNKLIRKYEGDNTFILSLKKSLKSKWCKTEEMGNKKIKTLSDRQYEIAKTILL